MKFLIVLASFLANSAFAIGYIPPVRSTSTINNVPGGTGSDYSEVGLIKAFEDYFTSGHYFLTFNVVRQELVNYRLPKFYIEQKCEFHPEGGAIGNYRPKAVWAQMLVASPSSGLFLWGDGNFGHVENDNPVVKKFDVLQQIRPLNDRVKQYFARVCATGLGVKQMTVVWASIGMCRWAREEWFKPGQFPLEYQLPTPNTINRQVRLNCVNQ